MQDREEQSRPGEHSFLRTRSPEDHQETLDALAKLFDEIERWHDEVATTHPAQPTSPLGLANELSEPFQASHTVSYLLLTAVDHLHAVRTLIKEAQAQHIFALYSLLRAAIEASSAALWILSDDDPRAIAVRSLKLENVNLRDLSNAYRTVNAPANDIRQREEALDHVITRNQMRRDNIKASPPGSLSILKAACEASGAGDTPILMWQMCSGAAHGRSWVSGFLTMMEARSDPSAKVISGRLTSDEQAVLLASYAACDLVRRLFATQRARSRDRLHTGDAFRPTSAGLVIPKAVLHLPVSAFGR